MDRDIKIFNRPIMQKIAKKNQQKHLQRLKNIKNGFSSRAMPNSTFYSTVSNHKINNKRAMMIQQQKKTEIQKQNVLLFNKMMKVMQRNDPNQPINYQNRNIYSSQQRESIRMNRTAIQNSRLTEQNRNIFERLEQQKPTISNKKLQQQRQKKLSLLKFMGKYPNPKAQRTSYDASISHKSRASNQKHQTYDPHGQARKKKLNTTLYFKYHNGSEQLDYDNQIDEMDGDNYDQQMKRYQEEVKKIKDKDHVSYNRRKFMSQGVNRSNKQQHQQQKHRISAYNNQNITMPTRNIPNKNPHKPQNQHQQPQPFIIANKNKINNNNNNRYSPQILLYQCQSLINNNKIHAIIKFTRTYNAYIITAYIQQKQKQKLKQSGRQYCVEIPEEDGNQFFSVHNYDYKGICQMLMIQDQRLVIHVEDGNKGAKRDIKRMHFDEKQQKQQRQEIKNNEEDEQNMPQISKPLSSSKQQKHNAQQTFIQLEQTKYEEDLQIQIQ